MTDYVPSRDRTGRKVHLGSTLRFQDTTGRTRVGTVVSISQGKMTIESPILEVPVSTGTGQPSGQFTAPDTISSDSITLTPDEVELWG